MNILTRESARAAYSDERLAELIPLEGLTPRQVAELPIPAEDRHWALCYTMGIDDTTLRLHAVWCTRRALRHVATPDQRSVHACDVAERFALGQATKEELGAARDAARDAVIDSMMDATMGAAMATAVDAACNAARFSTRESARDAARYAALFGASDSEREAQVSDLVERLS